MKQEIKLNYQSSTSEANNLIVCLHGNSTDSNYFSALLNQIDGWQVVAPDFVGHGKSPRLKPSEYHFEVFIQCLVDFINQFSFRKLVIIGHSMGGNLAIELMKVIQIDGVLLLAAPPVSYSSSFAPYLKLPNFELTENEQENIILIENFVSDFSSNQNVIDYLKETFLNTDSVFRDRLLQEFGAMKFSDQLAVLKQNKSTYVGCIIAVDDTGANNDFLNQLNNEGVFDFYAKIKDSGHYSLLEKPSNNYESIMKYLEKL
ncbi:MAG: alpha/beta hydrolase family protein [Brumimicrobium sp.]